ncbi:hypothetical protein M408DRAFT_326792 [Serendipita vermifera MAFF 305830]|uniref:Uncharacterized protein n=1 Tax=Serendipita vermifera MAFF 305830 TaxID=933852 RepID=A0A0C3B5N5_SERVB|nr:hypothetical protein M408DRAFT_326792 [Serendipita vermifera MAFF 305830]
MSALSGRPMAYIHRETHLYIVDSCSTLPNGCSYRNTLALVTPGRTGDENCAVPGILETAGILTLP